jgi:lincosamide and streptogramin A transport system ATP-binding/permease protein
MALINVTNLTFGYDTSAQNIFEDVSFHIDTDWKLGFTARNGRGKTTFLNLLLGRYPYSGTITSVCQYEYFPFDIPDKNTLTTDILRSIYPDFQQWEIERELSYLQVNHDVLNRPIGTLSKGEQTKVLLAILFLKENRFLLIDEPTNHLDKNGRKIVSSYLSSKKGFILVSHDRDFLDICVDHILSINKTDIEIQSGNFSSWWQNKERQDSFELAENQKLKKDIKRLEKSAREKAVWSDKVEATKFGCGPCDRGAIGHKAAKMMKRSKSIEKRQHNAISEKSNLLKNIETADALKISQLSYHTSKYVHLEHISILYHGLPICHNLSFEIENGDRIVLSGDNGTGKTSIIKLICGEDISYTGRLHVGSNLIISTVTQDTSMLSGRLDDFINDFAIEQSLMKAILRKLDFSRTQFDINISEYSDGQKKKLLIAKSLCEKAHLLIWDEPLNYIDVISRIQIENVLLTYKPTILFVEHDHAFCKKIATKTIELS